MDCQVCGTRNHINHRGPVRVVKTIAHEGLCQVCGAWAAKIIACDLGNKILKTALWRS